MPEMMFKLQLNSYQTDVNFIFVEVTQNFLYFLSYSLRSLLSALIVRYNTERDKRFEEPFLSRLFMKPTTATTAGSWTYCHNQ
jgi:hypothetical protein